MFTGFERDEELSILGFSCPDSLVPLSEPLQCIWLHPEAVAQFSYLDWTPSDRLRHASFVALREDKDPRAVAKEDEAIGSAW